MGAISRLNAINEMLIQSGEALVSDLDEQSGVDTSIASYILDQKITEFAMRGIAQNMATRKFKADGDGKIYLPVDLLSSRILDIIGMDGSPVNDVVENVGHNVVVRGISGTSAPYLYDLSTGTDWFDEAVIVTIQIVFDIEFEDMDTSIQKAVIYQAARTYQMLSQGDPAADQYLSQMEAYYEGKAKGWDNTAKDRNVLNSSPAYRAITRNRLGRTFPEQGRYPRGNGYGS
tara:strand:+ start:1404 stop:2096 length:693 start_codon:yes stop_codon:yes gene_type:complete